MDLDWRLVLFEAINFLVLMALLSRFLFRPGPPGSARLRKATRSIEWQFEQTSR